MVLIVDRFEGNYAVCEDEEGYPKNIELGRLPKGTAVGDVLRVTGETIAIDEAETKSRRAAAARALEDLWE